MESYLDDLIDALEGEAEEQRGQVKRFEGTRARGEISRQDGLLKRILQRLDTLKRLQASERARSHEIRGPQSGAG